MRISGGYLKHVEVQPKNMSQLAREEEEEEEEKVEEYTGCQLVTRSLELETTGSTTYFVYQLLKDRLSYRIYIKHADLLPL